jgi:DNA-binding XRE family transcriptional regulator
MPFKKIDTQKIVDEKKQSDPLFAEAYDEVKQEYELIRKVVNVRKERNLTQQELAEKVGVKQQVISRLEREKHIPTLTGFIKILNGLDLELSVVEKQAPYVTGKDSPLSKGQDK